MSQANQQPRVHEPAAEEVQQYADHYLRLAARIEDAKRAGAGPPQLWREISQTYPAEAGRLFCVCLRANCLSEWFRYVRGMAAWQHRSRNERAEALDYHMGRIVRLVKLAEGTENTPKWDLPTRDQECAALYAIIWFCVVRGWLAKKQPARFPADVRERWHPWSDGLDDSRLRGTGELDGPCTRAADFLVRFVARPGFTPDVLVLHAHADVQAEACRALADELTTGASIIAEVTSTDPEAPAIDDELRRTGTGEAGKPHTATDAEAPAKTFTVAAVREMTGLGNTALNKHAKAAGVKTPGRGKKNFRYSEADVRKILEWIIANTTEKRLLIRCRAALANLAEITK